MKIFTKEELIQKLKDISKMGWVKNARRGNQGGVGNTLEDLLGIKENNLPIPNAAEWELKTQRIDTSSLTTLVHLEPSPRVLKFVPKVFLPKYGWPHQEAGIKYPEYEMSFRQTIHAMNPSDRGFKVVVDKVNRKILISFNANDVDIKHKNWLNTVKERIGLGELEPQPYWGFDDLEHKAGTKLLNCFYVQAEEKKEKRISYFWYKKISMLRKFKFEGFIQALETANLLVDFDARTGHNHGTKFRLRQNQLPLLYEDITIIAD